MDFVVTCLLLTNAPYIIVWQAHSNAIFDVDWMDGEDKIVTASGDQTVALWDINTGDRMCTFRGHTSSVRSVNFQRNSSGMTEQLNTSYYGTIFITCA